MNFNPLKLVYDPDRNKPIVPTRSEAVVKPSLLTSATNVVVDETATTAPSSGEKTINPVFDAEIQEALGQISAPGFESFINTLQTLMEDITDEAKCYQMAFKSTVKSHPDLTAEVIMKTISKRLLALDNKNLELTKSLSDESNEALASKEALCKDLQKQIDDKKAQVDSLQKEIDVISIKGNTASIDVKIIKSKTEKRSEELDYVTSLHRKVLSEAREKLTQYLK